AGAVRAVSIAALRRSDVHVLSMGHISVGGGFSFPAIEFRSNAGNLVAALAAVPIYVHVGRGQARERRSSLVGPVGAVVSLFYPTVAHAACVVCRTFTAVGV